MVKLYKNFNINNYHKNSIILIGNFDGLHLGHQKLFKLAQSYNVSLEGEVGIVGYQHGKVSKGTNLNEAREFAQSSGVDAMAISVGNTHLQTSKIAKIDIDKIIEIQTVTKIPLVLHGSSGISYPMRKKIAKTTNVAKFNIGTELRMIAGNSLRKNINHNKNLLDIYLSTHSIRRKFNQ